jgi:c-di-GMP-binding flagellar brake protein YcgR
MATEPEAAQRRRDKRVKQWNKATLRVLGDGPGTTGPTAAEAYTYDLSLGGARIHSPARLAVGTRVGLRLELFRSRETVSIDGLVKWVRPSEADGVYEMGIAFDHSSSSTIMSLMKNLHDNRR